MQHHNEESQKLLSTLSIKKKNVSMNSIENKECPVG